MSVRNRILPFILVALAGCATQDQVKQLEEKVAALETKVDELGKSRGGAAPVDQKAEKEAAELLQAISKATQEGNLTEAKSKMARLKSKYATTTSYRRARKIEKELAVIGKDAPTEYKIDRWFQGERDVNLDGGKTTLLVFWEVWCPHCKREVPKIQATYEKFSPKGLQVVGLTKVSKSSTDEKVSDFIKESKVDYPMAKETGELSKHFNVSGIPAAAVVKDGKVVWRGHPGRLNDAMLESWL